MKKNTAPNPEPNPKSNINKAKSKVYKAQKEQASDKITLKEMIKFAKAS